MDNKCGICGANLENNLFSYVVQEKVCSICKFNFIGGLLTTPKQINVARKRLGLADGEYLRQNNIEEAKRILRR